MSDERGAISIEAAIALVVTISVVLTISLFTRIVYVHGVVQHAIIQTANEMASYSYFYSLTGLNEINGAAVSRKLAADGTVSESIDNVTDIYDNFTGGKYADAASSAQNLKTMNIKDILKSFCISSLGEVYEIGKTTGFNIVTKELMKTYMPENLERFFKIGMFENIDEDFPIDLSFSSYFSNADVDEISIVAAYNIKLAIPIPILDKDISIVQTAKSRAWLAEWKDVKSTDKTSVWDLAQFQRAEKIAATNSALNLPSNFKTIRGYDSNSKKASMFITINLNDDTYKGQASKIESQIKSKITSLNNYGGYTYSGTTVNTTDIQSVDYYVYIPKDASSTDKKTVNSFASSYSTTTTLKDGTKVSLNVIVKEVE